MRTCIAIFFVLGLISSYPVTADDIKQLNADSLDKALPANIIAAISNATSTETIYPISGDERFEGQILKADEIVFAPGATLTLSKRPIQWVAVVAKRIKFADPSKRSVIQFEKRIGSKGSIGNRGINGADNRGETGRTGNPGGHGTTGEDGGSPFTVVVPKIYLIAGEFLSPDGEPLLGSLKLALKFPGIDGGEGGKGGDGGNGGKAGNGKVGASSAFDCKEGGGHGGDGGNSGSGGRGGNGAKGGNGADLTLVSFKAGIELLSYANIVNTGGYGGRGGEPGRAGNPGRGGSGADQNGWCGPTSDGYDGKRPDPRDGGMGDDGIDGDKGTVTAITVNSLAPIFE